MAQTAQPIPLADAIRLCGQVSAAKLRRWWDPGGLQCRGCLRFSADVEHRCFAAQPGNRGCTFINEAWDRQRKD